MNNKKLRDDTEVVFTGALEITDDEEWSTL